ncbi:MAG: MFS transporter [Mycobacterium leprae]
MANKGDLPGNAATIAVHGDSSYKWLVLGVVGVGTFMSALDGNVVNIVIPTIQHQFHATLGGVSWVSTAYLLVICSLLLTFGRLGDLMGYKNVYSTGYAIFGLGSFLCGMTGSLTGLVMARILQGIGAAILMALGPALITTSFPPTERGKALGMQATLTYLGLTIGPSLGGMISQRFGWHWVFWINVPVSIAGGLLALTLLRPNAERKEQQFDLGGAAVLALGLTALLMALSQAEDWGWVSPVTISLWVGGLAAMVLFVWQETRVPQPMMPVWLLRTPAIAAGVLAAFLQYAVVFMLTFLLPFYLTNVRGLGPEQAGLVMTAQPLVMVAVAGLSGAVSDRIGTRWPASFGMAVLSVGLFLVSRAGVDHSQAVLMLSLALVGLGSGFFTAPNNSSIMGAAPRGHQGVASGLLAVARNVGMVTGIAVSGSLAAYLQASQEARGVGAGPAFLGAFQRTLLIAAALGIVGTIFSLARTHGSRRG